MAGESAGITLPSWQRLNDAVRRGDVAFALGLMAILGVLIMPMPKMLLDGFLALSITFSVMILMTALFIQKPLEFSSFPTVLLVATMLRLALNVASTRLILSNGHEGPAAAGEVIRAFGQFVMSGNFVIGVIVFSILVIINFVVITKGSGRIAEVSARFSLDSMPGKQMAIDADLSAGIINDREAKTRREELEQETSFYGAMDGAAKFVRGDAIAGLLITFINVAAGIIIGVVQNGMAMGDAFHTYTLLTVGDGLVSQIPALIISTAAGMLVSKGGVVGSADKALFGQLGAYPTALGLSSFLMSAFAFLPGIPMLPFLGLGLVTGMMAWKMTQAQEEKEMQEVQAAKTQAAGGEGKEQSLAESMQLDMIRLELGYGLLPMVNGVDGQKLTDQIKILRKQLASEVGFVLPSVRIMDNLQLPVNEYVIRVKEIESGRGSLRPNMFLCMNPAGQGIPFPGEDTREPTFNLPAKWIARDFKDDAESQDMTVVDTSVVLTTHLTEIIKDHMPELLSFTEVENLLSELDESHKKLLKDIVPNVISNSSIQRVLQNLLAERVSIRDLPTIIEAISDACTYTRNVTVITEQVRMRLARQLCAAHANAEGVLPVVILSPEWEDQLNQSLSGDGEIQHLALAPSQMQAFISRTRSVLDEQMNAGEMPVLLTGPSIRHHVRSIIERFRPMTVVMSQNEVTTKTKIKTLAQV